MHKLPVKVNPTALALGVQLTEAINGCDDTENNTATGKLLPLFKQVQGIPIDPFSYTMALNLCIRQTKLFGCCMLLKAIDHKDSTDPVAFEAVTQTVAAFITKRIKTRQGKDWETEEFTRYFLRVVTRNLKEQKQNVYGTDPWRVARMTALIQKLEHSAYPQKSLTEQNTPQWQEA